MRIAKKGIGSQDLHNVTLSIHSYTDFNVPLYMIIPLCKLAHRKAGRVYTVYAQSKGWSFDFRLQPEQPTDANDSLKNRVYNLIIF